MNPVDETDDSARGATPHHHRNCPDAGRLNDHGRALQLGEALLKGQSPSHRSAHEIQSPEPISRDVFRYREPLPQDQRRARPFVAYAETCRCGGAAGEGFRRLAGWLIGH